MKQSAILTSASVASVLFFTLHLTDDIVRGFEKGVLWNLIAVPVLVIWLYGALVLAGRLSGYVIILLGSLLGLLAPLLHFMGKGVGGELARSNGGFLFVWTLLALAVTSLLSLLLCLQGLRKQSWRQSQRNAQTGVRANY